MQGHNFHSHTNMRQRILFICHGNICRSPMAEAIFKHLAEEAGVSHLYEVDSAAVSTEEIGNGIYPPAQRCLQSHGIRFDKHRRARQVTADDYQCFDLLICMDSSNLRWLRHIIGEDCQHKVRLMMEFAGSKRDVADPWYTGDFEKSYDDILGGCLKMLETL